MSDAAKISKAKVRWTHPADQILLLKIIETHDLSVDTNKVAEAWRKSPSSSPNQVPSIFLFNPTDLFPAGDSGSKPTPRAVKERISKIKDLFKTGALEASNVATTPTSTPSKSGRGKSTATPRTPKASTSRKRKRQDASTSPEVTKSDTFTSEVEEDISAEDETPQKKTHTKGARARAIFKDEDEDEQVTVGGEGVGFSEDES
ncbi:uncharacterized protein N7459_004485 [Penicillium hispanicum]|uniref:uncharacterized protein n=1 Tax=Penicillium hispanicum TaxID=1080232 RepID=UPI002541585F|nr:uncharacterized protein N7459_004485 [Penicillium hispanicum]KAJ5584685.1 hypothetical protein N7459_004485 [Penicillium hispanicum]